MESSGVTKSSLRQIGEGVNELLSNKNRNVYFIFIDTLAWEPSCGWKLSFPIKGNLLKL